MARPRVADGGDGLQIWRVVSIILNNSRGQPIRGGLPAWWLGVWLTTNRENNFCMRCHKGPRDLTDFLDKRLK
jgi:hypothetical protein